MSENKMWIIRAGCLFLGQLFGFSFMYFLLVNNDPKPWGLLAWLVCSAGAVIPPMNEENDE